MSRRNRRRRSAAELLDTSRGILFPDEDELETPIQIGQLDQDSSSDPDQDIHSNPDQNPDSNPDQDNSNPDHQDTDRNLEQGTEGRPESIDNIPDHPPTEVPAVQMEQVEQLAALTQALQLAGRPSFKPPTFSGEEDIELFLRQFADVADANRWTPLERTLHIRSQLSGDAQSCGQGESYQEIVEDLRARYGLTRRGARDRLSSIRLKTNHNVHKQAAEISKLVKIAFPILPDNDQQTMALEYFSRAWESKAVQEHLLSRGPQTIREAVRATEEFLAIHESGPKPRAHVVERAPEEPAPAQEISDAGFRMMAEAMRTQTALLQQLILQLGSSQTQPVPSQPPPQPNAPLQCYSCGGPHLKRNCPSGQVAGRQTNQTGNGIGPAQA